MAQQHHKGQLIAYARTYSSDAFTAFWRWHQAASGKLPVRLFTPDADRLFRNIRKWPNSRQGWTVVPQDDLHWMPWLTAGPVVIDAWMVWLARKKCSPQLAGFLSKFHGKLMVCRREKAPAEENP